MTRYSEGMGQAFGAGFGGFERSVTGRADGDKVIVGLRAGLQHRVDNVDLSAMASFQVGRYSDENPVFLDQRSDRQTDLALQAAWQWTPAWSLRLSAVWTRNASNFGIYDYTRRDTALGVRYDFR